MVWIIIGEDQILSQLGEAVAVGHPWAETLEWPGGWGGGTTPAARTTSEAVSEMQGILGSATQRLPGNTLLILPVWVLSLSRKCTNWGRWNCTESQGKRESDGQVTNKLRNSQQWPPVHCPWTSQEADLEEVCSSVPDRAQKTASGASRWHRLDQFTGTTWALSVDKRGSTW